MDALRIKVFPTGKVEQGFDDVGTPGRGLGLSRDAETIAAIGDVDPKAPLDLPQVFVKLTTKVGQPVIVGGFQDDILGRFIGIQWLNDCPLGSISG